MRNGTVVKKDKYTLKRWLDTIYKKSTCPDGSPITQFRPCGDHGQGSLATILINAWCTIKGAMDDLRVDVTYAGKAPERITDETSESLIADSVMGVFTEFRMDGNSIVCSRQRFGNNKPIAHHVYMCLTRDEWERRRAGMKS